METKPYKQAVISARNHFGLDADEKQQNNLTISKTKTPLIFILLATVDIFSGRVEVSSVPIFSIELGQNNV